MTDPLRSARLIYRAVEPAEDIDFRYSLEDDTVARINSNPSLLRPPSHAQVEKFLKEVPDKCLIFVVICLPPATTTPSSNDSEKTEPAPKPTPIGSISLTASPDAMRHHRYAGIGLQIHKDYRNKGYGTEAIEWVMQWGFEVAGLHRITIGTASFNTGAVKVYERMGFVRESTARETLWYNGEWHDRIEWALLEHEWRERRAGGSR